MNHSRVTLTRAMIAACCLVASPAGHAGANHTVIQIGFALGQAAEDSAGGLIAADVDNDRNVTGA